jgi:hypothetical protein
MVLIFKSWTVSLEGGTLLLDFGNPSWRLKKLFCNFFTLKILNSFVPILDFGP